MSHVQASGLTLQCIVSRQGEVNLSQPLGLIAGQATLNLVTYIARIMSRHSHNYHMEASAQLQHSRTAASHVAADFSWTKNQSQDAHQQSMMLYLLCWTSQGL